MLWVFIVGAITVPYSVWRIETYKRVAHIVDTVIVFVNTNRGYEQAVV